MWNSLKFPGKKKGVGNKTKLRARRKKKERRGGGGGGNDLQTKHMLKKQLQQFYYSYKNIYQPLTGNKYFFEKKV